MDPVFCCPGIFLKRVITEDSEPCCLGLVSMTGTLGSCMGRQSRQASWRGSTQVGQAQPPLPSPQPPAQPLPVPLAASPVHSEGSSDAYSPLRTTEGQSDRPGETRAQGLCLSH
jgi:hypothetical protein